MLLIIFLAWTAHCEQELEQARADSEANANANDAIVDALNRSANAATETQAYSAAVSTLGNSAVDILRKFSQLLVSCASRDSNQGGFRHALGRGPHNPRLCSLSHDNNCSA